MKDKLNIAFNRQLDGSRGILSQWELEGFPREESKLLHQRWLRNALRARDYDERYVQMSRYEI